MLNREFRIQCAFHLAGILLALAFVLLLVQASGAPPLEAFRLILEGAFGSAGGLADVLVAWVPLLLASGAVLITFSAGLWNIGIEGQIILGAIGCTWALRLCQAGGWPPLPSLLLAFLAGMAAAAGWALLAGALRTVGGVNEIFGGLGLNFVATALTIWLIFEPWKRPGTGSMSGTEPFTEAYRLPTLEALRFSPWSLAIGAGGLVLAWFILSKSRLGLQLRAVGDNPRAAFLLGVPTSRCLLLGFALGGVLAGLAGCLQVTAVYHRLIPSVSSGYGFLGFLVALLIRFRTTWAAPVALFYAAINIGSIQLPIVLQLDSSLAGVLQGALVLSVMVLEGLRQRLLGTAGEHPGPHSGARNQTADSLTQIHGWPR